MLKKMLLGASAALLLAAPAALAQTRKKAKTTVAPTVSEPAIVRPDRTDSLALRRLFD